MPSLYWDIRWRWGAHTLTRETKQACAHAILKQLIGSGGSFTSADLGYTLEGLAISMQNMSVEFSATLTHIEPSGGFSVDNRTNIYVHEPSGKSKPSGLGNSPEGEMDEFILRRITFDPMQPDPDYLSLYDSLIGIEKEMILEEAISLLASPQMLTEWGIRHYRKVPSILRTAMNKAPAIIFGGDPGTGKTALATSIGSRLSMALGEKVHFRHMSLSMRGRGIQGLASTLIVRSFEQINQEYTRLREPMIIFFDEAEAIVGSRDHVDVNAGTQQDIAIVDAVIVGIDSLRKGGYARVVVIFATNVIGRIDPALMRRCYCHSFARPNEQNRRKLLKASLKELNINDADLNLLVDATKPHMLDGEEVAFTHSDIIELIVVRAVNAAIRLDKPVTTDLLLDYCDRTTPTKSVGIDLHKKVSSKGEGKRRKRNFIYESLFEKG